MSSYVLSFQDIDSTKLPLVGGKGANLGELSRLEGLHVPDGFCITTEAFQRVTANIPSLERLLDDLSRLAIGDLKGIADLSAEVRRIIEALAIPHEITGEIARRLSGFDRWTAYAVRSSATVEDLPSASFAGQHDTYLNIVGTEAVLAHIRRCWVSLFTDRAVIYRLQQGFDHRAVHLAVIVQQMVFPQAAGILFTADPVTSHRKVSSIDAGFGLGEAMVSGLVNADSYKVRDGTIIDKTIAAKTLALYAAAEGGTKEQQLAPELQDRQVLTDEQIVRLERIGRMIEGHFGRPQDIEWCLAGDVFQIVQSRPITTLYPIPEPAGPGYHVYVSVGHQQMMTAPLKPLGLSIFQLTSIGPRFSAGGRLFVDVAPMLASAASREALVAGMGQHDPLMQDALTTIIERGEFASPLSGDAPDPGPARRAASADAPVEIDPAIVAALIQSSRASIEALRQEIEKTSGLEIFDFILESIQQLKKALVDPRSSSVFMAAINASLWLNEHMDRWLGEKNAADALSQSVPNNITSEMGLALLDVADVIRRYPDVIDYLQRAEGDHFLHDLRTFEGGEHCHQALSAFLATYGMRCAGEIDITRPRWSEKPATLIPMLLSSIKNSEPGAAGRRFEQGRRDALQKERDLLDRLKLLPDGEHKAEETKRMIDRVRNFIGYREYPKYDIVSRYFLYKQALLREVEKLVRAGVLREKEDSYYLPFEELRDVVRTGELDYLIIARRKDEYRVQERLSPPRIITSDGEVVEGRYRRANLPAEALVGLAVSSGVIEGRARVLLSMEEADLEDGDILVTPFTDPSWTPLFVLIRGLVTEVGGLMTHGAVIAREYGLPAVVGVENATKRIRDGARIRVNGTDGYVEIL